VAEEEGYRYVIRLKASAVLEREIEHLLTRPVGRPSRKPKVFYHSFHYQVKSWLRSRRVVARVEWHQGELFPRVGFIATNFLRRLALPKSIRQWSLTTLREKLVKIGAKVTRHSKYVTFQLAKVVVPRQLFAAILEQIGRLAMPLAVCRSG